MKNLKDILESLFDIDDNINNLDPEVMYGVWNAKDEHQYEEIGERMEKLIKNDCKIASYMRKPYTGWDLKPGKYYMGFNWMLDGGPMFALDVFYKKHNKCFKLEFWWADYEGKLRIGHHEIPLDKKIWIDPKELYEANKTMTWVIEKLIKLAK